MEELVAFQFDENKIMITVNLKFMGFGEEVNEIESESKSGKGGEKIIMQT